MATFKFFKLPEKGVTEELFLRWKETLEEYLSKDKILSAFLSNGAYCNWEAYKVNPNRITEPAGEDKMEQVKVRQDELRRFLKIVAKACDLKHYDPIIGCSTSLKWIYSRLCEDYNILQSNTNNFFDLFDVCYMPGGCPVDFYTQYRNVVISNLRKEGDIILWQNSRVLESDELLSPTFEDLILANVLGLIDSRLLGFVRDNYRHMIDRSRGLMDYRVDILLQVPTFLVKKEDPNPEESTEISQLAR